MIYFQPDAQGGNSGPQGFATIRNGAFDTKREGKGTVGGPMIVRITGFDSEPPKDLSETEPGPKPLFAEYQTKADLPKEDGNQDFDVPASAADGPVARRPPCPPGRNRRAARGNLMGSPQTNQPPGKPDCRRKSPGRSDNRST